MTELVKESLEKGEGDIGEEGRELSEKDQEVDDSEVQVVLASSEPKEKKLHPEGGWGWMVVLGSALAHFLVVGLGR